MRRCAFLFSLLALALAARPSAAQNEPPSVSPSLNLRGFSASTDPSSGVYYEPASSPDHLAASGSAWLSYASSQVLLREPGTGAVIAAPLENSLTGDFTFSMGLYGRAAIGVVLPYAIYQDSSDPNGVALALLGDTKPASQALGDLTLVGKVTLIKPTAGDLGGFALAIHERFSLPTGDETSYLGEGAVMSETRFLAEYTTRAIGLYAAVGARFRGSEEDFLCISTNENCLTRVGHTLPFGLSLRITPRGFGIDPERKWTLFAELFGHVPLAPLGAFNENRLSTLEAATGARYVFERDFSLLASVGTSIVAGLGAPSVRGILSVSFAPRGHDADQDGVDDDIDQCRELAEDHDGFEDNDGCPEGDNDQDTVPDHADKCPLQAEDLDQFEDDDGCPDPDNDNDGILDVNDACPNEAGISNANPSLNGCPRHDRDNDGILDDDDTCPAEPEDIDNFQDGDGCPDPDNDGDGVLDGVDTCPNVPGVYSTDPKQSGCPEVDADNDTFFGAEDKCPLEEEDFNGKDDGDGCPDDPKRKRFVTVVDQAGEPSLSISKGVRFARDGSIDPASIPVLRAIAAELMKHPALGTKPAWSVAIGVRPSPVGGHSEAMLKAFSVVDALRKLTRRDAIAETVGWAAVKDLPGAAAHGIGFLLLTGASDASQGNTDAPKK